MTLFKSKKASAASLKSFHANDYVEYLENVDPKYHMDDMDKVNELLQMDPTNNCYNLGDDCPVFYGIFDYSCLYAGATLKAASLLMENVSVSLLLAELQ